MDSHGFISLIDLADRKVVGWSLSEDMTTDNTVYAAWLNARKNREVVEGFTLHRQATLSDRGVQYASHQISNLFLLSSKMKQSMTGPPDGRKGNCWDKAVAESFFKTVKCKLIYLQKWTSFEQVFHAIGEYIHWYNTKRIHQGLDYITPLEKEQLLRNMFHKKAA